MSYGEQLDVATGAVARAYAALRDPPPEAAARASAALSRARLYRSLERQIVALGSVHAGDLPLIGDLPRLYQPAATGRSPITALAVGLRHAAAGTVAVGREGRADLPADGFVAVAMRQAFQAVQTAGDILFSNTGAKTGPGEQHRPHTAEGMALLAGLGRSDNLAALASLAAAAAEMDVRLARWLWPEDAPAELRPLLAAAEQDAWHTKSGPLRETALLVAAGGDPRRAPVLGMAAAPPVDDPLRWAHPTSGSDCVEAIDAARSWLIRRGQELTVEQLAGVAGAALAITHYVGHVHMRLTSGSPDLSTAVAAAARPWRGVLQAVAELRSPVPQHANHSTLSVAVGGAATWLRGQLRPDGRWLDPDAWAGDAAERVTWWSTAAQITARLPDLADLLRQAIEAAHARGGVLAATGRLSPRSGQLVHAPEWRPAPTEHRSYRALTMALDNAAGYGRELAAAVGVQPRPGVRDVADAGRQAAPSRAARLAGQWYPGLDGMTEPTLPATTTGGRSGGQRPNRRQQPGDRPTRR